MIGTDIVDLKQAAKDSNWKRPRFLEKVFTPEEQLLIFSSLHKDQMVWRLWSMKEAAYKAYVRECKNVFFNPKRLECQLDLDNEGIVCVNNKSYEIISVMTTEYIHSVARKIGTECLEIYLFRLSAFNQSDVTRAKIKSYIAHATGKEMSSFEIKKTKLGVPNIFVNNKQIFEALSISHHGKYGAFAIS